VAGLEQDVQGNQPGERGDRDTAKKETGKAAVALGDRAKAGLKVDVDDEAVAGGKERAVEVLAEPGLEGEEREMQELQHGGDAAEEHLVGIQDERIQRGHGKGERLAES
jgi:hypothetical protein